MRKLIVGGGAAGLLCAGFAAGQGKEVVVLERNARPARKVLITGKGRCNVTNDCSPTDLIANVRTNPRFLYGAMNAFSASDAMALFTSLGVALKTERGRRVFPVSDQASDIVDAMIRFAKDSGATILTGKCVKEILSADSAVTGVAFSDGTQMEADAVVIATGGRSYPRTGSDGDGYRMAQSLGHTIIAQRPSLVPLLTKETWCAELSGLSLKNVTLTVQDSKGKVVYSELGEMLFTHTGVSGPLVLSASAYMEKGASAYRLFINMKPALSVQQLDARILRDIADNQNKAFANVLGLLLPRTMVPVVMRLLGLAQELKCHSVTREQRAALVALLQALPLEPKAFGSLDEAVITAGGVSVKEIDPKTMQSKLVRGLYFAGEVIDVDAFTGGYNLQIAYSTAYLAAQAL